MAKQSKKSSSSTAKTKLMKRPRSMALKVVTKAGRTILNPHKKIRTAIKMGGYTGKLAIDTVKMSVNEAKKMTVGGVVTATNLEKAVVNAMNQTNKKVMTGVQKAVKRLLN